MSSGLERVSVFLLGFFRREIEQRDRWRNSPA